MATQRELELRSESHGCESRALCARITEFTGAERFRRAARIFFPLLAAALVSLPVPGWHLAAVPGFLLAGLVLGGRRLSQRERLEALEGSCPACTREQAFPAPERLSLPLTLRCPACGEFVRIREVQGG